MASALQDLSVRGKNGSSARMAASLRQLAFGMGTFKNGDRQVRGVPGRYVDEEAVIPGHRRLKDGLPPEGRPTQIALPQAAQAEFQPHQPALTLATPAHSVVYLVDKFPRRICHGFSTPSAANFSTPRPYRRLIASSVPISRSFRLSTCSSGTNKANC